MTDEKPELTIDALRSRLRAFAYAKSLRNLHDRPDRTQLCPSDRGRLSRPGRSRSSGWRFHAIVQIA